MEDLEISEPFNTRMKHLLDLYCGLKTGKVPDLDAFQTIEVIDVVIRWLVGQYLYGFAVSTPIRYFEKNKIEVSTFSELCDQSTKLIGERFGDLKMPAGDLLVTTISLSSP